MKLHIDGARIFNAAVDQNTTVKELTKSADSISVCLSKGLCAPVGSVLIGTKEFITEARRKRKMLGRFLQSAREGGREKRRGGGGGGGGRERSCLHSLIGGGMRQAGVLAAAGLIALHKMSKRLDEDHRHAALLAEQLRQCNSMTQVRNADQHGLLQTRNGLQGSRRRVVPETEGERRVDCRSQG